MLTAIRLELEAISNGTLPYGNSMYIHGLFFNILKEFNNDLSRSIHDKDELKPYTLSLLMGTKHEDWILNINCGGIYYFRATFMDDSLLSTFYEGIYHYLNNGKILRIGNVEFKIASVILERSEHVEELICGRAIVETGFKLHFLSPTNFRIKGKSHLYPDPYHLFKSFSDKWNAFNKKTKSISAEVIEIICNNCLVSRYNLQTELLDMGKYKMVGFKGSCFYEINQEIQEAAVEIINCLLRYSFYCGTGYKTTMGMGQTRFKKKC